MKNMKELLGIPQRRWCNGQYGVEIEVEGTRLPIAIDNWRVEHDGSLKAAEAYEYVMPQPLDIAGVRNALKELEDTFTAHKSVVDESVRAGVHVHMNVQNWNVLQLYTFAVCYFVLEDLLVKWCGENREGNLFCLRSGDAENILFQLQRAVQKKDLRLLDHEDYRYCSLNFMSLFKYGSLEFRSMRSTPNLDLIREWVDIINELQHNALNYRNPVDVLLSMSGAGEEFFVKRLLPNFWEKLVFSGYEKHIRAAARRVQMVVFTIEWDDLDKPSKNPFIDGGAGF